MNVRDFEQRLLAVVFQSKERLTPHFVAYQLGLPFAETKAHLEKLAQEGVISMELDDNGAIWYEVPGAERLTEAKPAYIPAAQPPRPVVVAAPRVGLRALPLVGLLVVGGLLLKVFFFPLLLLFLFLGLGRGLRFGRRFGHRSHQRGYHHSPQRWDRNPWV